MDNPYTQNTRRRLRTAYLTSTVSISLVLFVLGIMGLLVLNAQRLSNYVKENIGFSIILKDNIKEADKIWFQKELDATEYIKSTKYITKEQAAKELMDELGEDFIGFLGYNPLLASIDARLYADYANPDSIAKIQDEMKRYSAVKEILYQESLIHLVNKNIQKISAIFIVFTFLLLIIAITLINNTIRLMVYAKRFSIKTMQLVGATDAFIRKPFLFKSSLYGIVGAFFALFFLYLSVFFIENEFAGIIKIQSIGTLSISLILLGILLTGISTYFAVNKYIKLNINDLYY